MQHTVAVVSPRQCQNGYASYCAIKVLRSGDVRVDLGVRCPGGTRVSGVVRLSRSTASLSSHGIVRSTSLTRLTSRKSQSVERATRRVSLQTRAALPDPSLSASLQSLVSASVGQLATDILASESVTSFLSDFLPLAEEHPELLAPYIMSATAGLAYATAPPSALLGFADFFSVPLQRTRTFSSREVKVGRQMGEGNFGVVYEGFFSNGKQGREQKWENHVVLKRVKPRVECSEEMRDVELYMNQRVQRCAPGISAEFLGTMLVEEGQVYGKLQEGLWLVWTYQGDRTLEALLQNRNYPNNIARQLLGVELPDKKGSGKEVAKWVEWEVAQTVMRQLLDAMSQLHSAGIVHRDIKPSNLILNERDGRFCIIDLGACVDLRTGHNFVPNETVMDPKYSAPERFVMPPSSTLPYPPDPLATLVSPVMWALNTPDRFDMFSAGIVFMQLCVKQLRYEPGLNAFNKELKKADYDLNKWRKLSRRISRNDLAVLDTHDGAGWRLACALLRKRHNEEEPVWPSGVLGQGRPSAAEALRYPFFSLKVPEEFRQYAGLVDVVQKRRERQLAAAKAKAEGPKRKPERKEEKGKGGKESKGKDGAQASSGGGAEPVPAFSAVGGPLARALGSVVFAASGVQQEKEQEVSSPRKGAAPPALDRAVDEGKSGGHFFSFLSAGKEEGGPKEGASKDIPVAAAANGSAAKGNGAAAANRKPMQGVPGGRESLEKQRQQDANGNGGGAWWGSVLGIPDAAVDNLHQGKASGKGLPQAQGQAQGQKKAPVERKEEQKPGASAGGGWWGAKTAPEQKSAPEQEAREEHRSTSPFGWGRKEVKPAAKEVKPAAKEVKPEAKSVEKAQEKQAEEAAANGAALKAVEPQKGAAPLKEVKAVPSVNGAAAAKPAKGESQRRGSGSSGSDDSSQAGGGWFGWFGSRAGAGGREAKGEGQPEGPKAAPQTAPQNNGGVANAGSLSAGPVDTKRQHLVVAPVLAATGVATATLEKLEEAEAADSSTSLESSHIAPTPVAAIAAVPTAAVPVAVAPSPLAASGAPLEASLPVLGSGLSLDSLLKAHVVDTTEEALTVEGPEPSPGLPPPLLAIPAEQSGTELASPLVKPHKVEELCEKEPDIVMPPEATEGTSSGQEEEKAASLSHAAASSGSFIGGVVEDAAQSARQGEQAQGAEGSEEQLRSPLEYISAIFNMYSAADAGAAPVDGALAEEKANGDLERAEALDSAPALPTSSAVGVETEEAELAAAEQGAVVTGKAAGATEAGGFDVEEMGGAASEGDHGEERADAGQLQQALKDMHQTVQGIASDMRGGQGGSDASTSSSSVGSGPAVNGADQGNYGGELVVAEVDSSAQSSREAASGDDDPAAPGEEGIDSGAPQTWREQLLGGQALEEGESGAGSTAMAWDVTEEEQVRMQAQLRDLAARYAQRDELSRNLQDAVAELDQQIGALEVSVRGGRDLANEQKRLLDKLAGLLREEPSRRTISK